jgi:periplasmic copper chaperone A
VIPTVTPAPERDDSRPARGRRLPAGFLAAALALALGLAGLVIGARQPASGGGISPTEAAPLPAGAVAVGDLTVSGAYVREPASPNVAAAYLTMRNGGDQADSLESAYSGAARETSLHGRPGVVKAGAHADSGPIPLPAGTSVTLAPGRGHLMLEGLTGRLAPGDKVSLLLRFARAGQVLVEAPVIAIGAPAPGGAPS